MTERKRGKERGRDLSQGTQIASGNQCPQLLAALQQLMHCNGVTLRLGLGLKAQKGGSHCQPTGSAPASCRGGRPTPSIAPGGVSRKAFQKRECPKKKKKTGWDEGRKETEPRVAEMD